MAQQPTGFIPDGFEPDTTPPAMPPQAPTTGQKVAAAAGGVVQGAGLDPRPMLTAFTNEIGSELAHPSQVATLIPRMAMNGLIAPLLHVPGAWKALKEGRLTDAANEFTKSIPVLGPMASEISQATKSNDPLERARGYGQAAGVIASPLIGEGITRGATAGTRAVVNTVRDVAQNANPVEAAALQYAAREGVPVDAATMSGNSVLKGVKHITDRSLAGSVVASRGQRAEAAGLEALGNRLANKTGVGPQTPESASTAVTGGLTQRIKDLDAAADAGYGRMRQLEQQTPGGFWVDRSGLKATVKPIYDRMMRATTPAQQAMSKPLKAFENILNGPDIVPADVADADLSMLKGISRDASMPELRDAGQGAAARAVAELEAAVQAAVAKGGPEAVAARNAGRQATRLKYAVSDILDSLNREPVRAYGQTTAPKDANINLLRDIARETPTEIPKIGRAVLDEMLSRATDKGGFQGAAKLSSDWDKLGTETKALLFPTTGLTKEIDQFMLAAKKLAENPNPSGTGGMNIMTAQAGAGGGALALAATGHPGALALFGLGELTAYGLAKALRSPTTLRVLTTGMQAAPGSARAIAARQLILKLNSAQQSKGAQ